MAGYYFYQVINVGMMLTILGLIGILFERLEVKENRYLFVGCIGQGLDLISWYVMSHIPNVDGAIVFLRLSICARLLFGLGFVGYMSSRYSARLTKLVTGIWGLSMVATFTHTMFMPEETAYLGQPSINSIGGIMVLDANRGPVYYFYFTCVLMMGTWSLINIIHNKRGSVTKGREAVMVNDIFYIVALCVQGFMFTLVEVHYGEYVNIVPLTRAMFTGIYAILSIRYNLIDFDNLAGQSLMNDVGGAFFVYSDKYELLYANENAYKLYPELSTDAKEQDIIKTALSKRVFQIERNGSTYRVNTNPINKNGRIEGYTILMIDVSDMVALENRAVLNEISRKNLLTNISHELRTPLNAIIGASEMLKNTEGAKEEQLKCAELIENSAANLNDVLDDILSVSDEYDSIDEENNIPYSVYSLVSNVADVIEERLLSKKINFSLNFSEDIPLNAVGDDKKIRKILRTVLSNAIRYTDEGSISLKIDGEYLIDGKFLFEYIIRDTGQTVLKEGNDVDKTIYDNNDLGVDYTTGYGISLMVAKRLTESMGGSFAASAKKGKYNEYTISIPSQVIDRQNLQSMDLSSQIKVSVLDGGDNTYEEFIKACNNLGVEINIATGLGGVSAVSSKDTFRHFLVFDFEKYGKKIAQSDKYNNMTLLAVLKQGTLPKNYAGNLIFVKPPLSGLTLLTAFLETELRSKEGRAVNKNFTAPEAKIMVVDDNSINLYIAENMLSQFGIKADLCISGYECVEHIRNGNDYDLIFMDYMMEGMDGIEATEKIRHMKSSISRVPILAYTANAVEGAKEKFIAAGMNGCIFKPADFDSFAEALKNYLPKHLLLSEGKPIADESDKSTEGFPDIEGVDKNAAIKYSGGNSKLYIEMLTSFHKEIPEKAKLVCEYATERKMRDLSVLSHGIKSLSRTLGITYLSHLAAEVEKASTEENYEKIDSILETFIKEYEGYELLLSPFVIKEDTSGESHVPKNETEEILLKMHDMLEEFEIDETERLFNALWPGEYSAGIRPLMKGLKDSIERVDYYASKEYIEKMLKIYKED